MSKIYKISLFPKSGFLTDLQSDTIFGHFCWRLRDKLGEDKLTEFLKFYSDGNPIFTISNSLFEKNSNVFFPKPFLPIQKKDSIHNISKKDKIIEFRDYKKKKKNKYLSLTQFNEILSGNKIDFDCEESENFHFNNELRVSVEIDRNTFTSKEGQLFSYAPKYIEKDINLCILLKIINEENFKNFDCKNIINDVFELGFGKKKSSGYGEFEIKSFEVFNQINEPSDSNAFITLSNYLPSEDDTILDAYYDINVKYGKLGEHFALSPNPFKNPIIFMVPGSCFKTSIQKDFYGRCTAPGEINYQKEIIHYGLAFSLKIKT